MSTGWPAILRDDSVRASVVLRPLKRSDANAWVELRARNADWLEPWEASHPNPVGTYPLSFGAYVRGLNSQGRAGATLSFAVLVDDELVGQVSVSTIVWGSMCSGNLGYWVSEGSRRAARTGWRSTTGAAPRTRRRADAVNYTRVRHADRRAGRGAKPRVPSRCGTSRWRRCVGADGPVGRVLPACAAPAAQSAERIARR